MNPAPNPRGSWRSPKWRGHMFPEDRPDYVETVARALREKWAGVQFRGVSDLAAAVRESDEAHRAKGTQHMQIVQELLRLGVWIQRPYSGTLAASASGRPLESLSREELQAEAHALHWSPRRDAAQAFLLSKRNPEAAGAREAKRGLQEIGKQREQAFRDREREKLEHLRQRVAELQARKRDAMHAIVRQCKAARAELPARVRAIRSAAKVEGAELRQATANRCQFRKVKTRAAAGAALGRARAELRQERRDQRLIRRAGKKPPARVRAHEARAESDSAVEANIPAELVPIWRRVKGQIRAGAGVSRTEAFLRWVEENPGEVWAMREAQAEAELRRLVAEEARAARTRPRKWATRGEVPF